MTPKKIETRTVAIATLEPGTRFLLRLSEKTIRGTVEDQGPGSTSVILEGRDQDRAFETATGERVAFTRPGRRTTWAQGTMVEVAVRNSPTRA